MRRENIVQEIYNICKMIAKNLYNIWTLLAHYFAQYLLAFETNHETSVVEYINIICTKFANISSLFPKYLYNFAQ